MSEIKCQKEGCNETAIECYLPYYYDNPDEYLCPYHAVEAGYCCRCGNFSSGLELFDFNRNGLCPDCQVEIDNEQEDFDEIEGVEF